MVRRKPFTQSKTKDAFHRGHTCRIRRSTSTSCALRIATAVAIVAMSPHGNGSHRLPFTTAVAAAFVHDGPTSQCRYHRSMRSTHPTPRRPSHHFSSSPSGNNYWGEIFQNAIGTLDKRNDVEGSVSEKKRRWRNSDNGEDTSNYIEFVSPLLEDGYPPAVLEYERQQQQQPQQQPQPQKPMLLYLPGFDGTILAPFLQFPSLGEEFDVRAMKVDMADRSTFEELKEVVVEYILRECRGGDNTNSGRGGSGSGGAAILYLMGESFGGILATEVALELHRPAYRRYIDLRGLILVNPATSFLRSKLYELGPPVANAQFGGQAQYIVSLATQLVPLFLDEGVAIRQLLSILSSKGLPAVVNAPQREAYMGRVAFDLANRLKFMPKDTLQWRLEEWLEWGCGIFEDRLEMLNNEGGGGDVDTAALLQVSQELRTLIVVGEYDKTLPSREESQRLANEMFRKAYVHIVPGAGHASTCGGSLNLIRLLREVFPEVDCNGGGDGKNNNGNHGDWAVVTSESLEELHGLEPRYDGAWIGLNPFLYWSKDYYRKWRR